MLVTEIVVSDVLISDEITVVPTITSGTRLSTLRYCDKVVELDSGEIKKVYNNKEFLKKFQNLF